MKSDVRQMAVIERNQKILAVVLQGNEIDQVLVDDMDDEVLRTGDIYVGKVKNIIPNINAAFVEVRKSVMCYLPLDIKAKRVVQEQEVVVQIKKAAVKSKQAVASLKFEFPGKYVVVTTENLAKTISSKITDSHERERLQMLLGEWREEKFGIIMRTSCEKAQIEQIREECQTLLEQANEVTQHAAQRTCYSRIYQAEEEYVQFIKNMGENGLERVITDRQEVYDSLQKKHLPSLPEEKLVFYEDKSYSLDALLGISSKIDKLLCKHVWLKSGGSLVIEHTEALTVIDVNTEKAISGKRNRETTFLKINLEAAKEAARQIRVRNISGIIVIDFIDMKDKSNEKQLLSVLQEEFCKDKVRTTVVDITKLGLVEITRMKISRPLRECL